MRRVVCTGIGSINCLGSSVSESFHNLISAKSGIRRLFDPKFDSLACKIAGVAPDPKLFFELDQRQERIYDRATRFSLISAKEALDRAGWSPTTTRDIYRTGVCIGAGNTNSEHYFAAQEIHKNPTVGRNSNFIPKIMHHTGSFAVAQHFNLKGPNFSPYSACATSMHAIGLSYNMIKYGEADVMVTGASDSNIEPILFSGFCSINALCTNHNDSPQLASKPFDKNNSGFVISEGAGILVLEEYEHAKSRNSPILCEILGFSQTCDANSIYAPNQDAQEKTFTIQQCLDKAGLDPKLVSYINAHATSTPKGDNIELLALSRVFENTDAKISSNKGSIGHSLSSAAAIELIFSIKSLETNVIPPNLNLDNIDAPESLLENIVSNKSLDLKKDLLTPIECNYVVKNSYAFGGINTTLCIGRHDA